MIVKNKCQSSISIDSQKIKLLKIFKYILKK